MFGVVRQRTSSTDEEILSILSAPIPPDAAEVLSRRGRRPLTEAQALKILQAGQSSADPDPLPTAIKTTVPPLPLVYQAPPPPGASGQINHAQLPLAYRVLRVGLWLSVAAAMLAVMIWSVRPQ